MPSDEDLLRLARRDHEHTIRLAQRTTRSVDAVWSRVGGLNDQALAAFRDAVVPLIEEARRQSMRLTEAYLNEYAAAAGDPYPGVRVVPNDVVYRGGVDIAEVYARPTIEARVAISRGASFVEAIAAGRARAVQLADTDVMLAANQAAHQIMSQIPRVQGYRRVPDAGACEFCLLAATQRYHEGQLMPLHPGCHCGVVPIIGTRDPGRIIDREAHQRLAGTQEAISRRRSITDGEQAVANYEQKAKHWREQARTTTDQLAETRYAKRADEWAAKADARRARLERDRTRLRQITSGDTSAITVHQHGELGPTLYPAGQAFTAA